MSSSSSSSFPVITEETVCASAPGKVILFGEHAVVYGHPAVAAALTDLRIVVWVTPTDDDDGTVRMRLPDLSPAPVDWTLCLDDDDDDDDDVTWPVPPRPHETAAAVADYLRRRRRRRSTGDPAATTTTIDDDDDDDWAVTAVTPIVYLLRTLFAADDNTSRRRRRRGGGYHVYVRSRDLPVGAGLGSSAAFSVALAAALLRLRQRQEQHDDDDDARPSLDAVNRTAHWAEILLHGHPSGLDDAVATYGGALQYQKDKDGQTVLRPLPRFTQRLELLLVHTHVPRSTKALVAAVRDLHTRYPTVVGPILQSMGEIAAAFGRQQQERQQVGDDDRRRALLDWVRLNHRLLRAVGVSHPRLERLVELVEDAVGHDGSAACKLTGAGGGGCALVVWSNDDARRRVMRRLQRSRRHGYTCLVSTVGGDRGVLWHDDAAAALYDDDDAARRRRSIMPLTWSVVVAGASVVTAVVAVTVLTRKSR